MIDRLILSTLVLPGILFFLGACSAVEVQTPGASHGQNAHPKEVETDMTVEEEEPSSIGVVDLSRTSDLQGIIPELLNKRVVFVGESHDAYGHHLAQFEIIKGIHDRAPDMAIGMEMFQQPYQDYLDAYIAGELDEREMLAKTEWFDRWRYDYRLYQPILRYAKQNRIPVIALNISQELRQRVSKVGLDGLEPEERKQVPAEIDRSDKRYEKRLKGIFGKHSGSGKRSFDRFIEVQLLWDETMAEQAASYLKAHPARRLVVLAGTGHLMYGAGIPQRVSRRIPVKSATVLPGTDLPAAPGIADYLIFPSKTQLPRAGLMGVFLGDGKEGEGARLERVVENSAAEKAGLREGDYIQLLDDRQMHNASDVKIALLGKRPGDRVRVSVLRKRFLVGEERLDLEVELGE